MLQLQHLPSILVFQTDLQLLECLQSINRVLRVADEGRIHLLSECQHIMAEVHNQRMRDGYEPNRHFSVIKDFDVGGKGFCDMH